MEGQAGEALGGRRGPADGDGMGSNFPGYGVCAVIDRGANRTTVSRAADRQVLWTADVAPARALVGNSGTLIEEYAGGVLLEPDVGPDSVLMTVRNASGVLRQSRLRDVAAEPGALPARVSHRQWTHFAGFRPDEKYVVQTMDGRLIHVDLASGALTAEAVPGGEARWACLYGAPNCARRR